MGMLERAHETDYLIGVDQKIPDWLFLREVGIAIRSGIKSRFDKVSTYKLCFVT